MLQLWFHSQDGYLKYSQLESNIFQKSAFECNPKLLKPKEGINYTKINNINAKRAKRLIDNITSFVSYDQLMLEINNVLEGLSFGTHAEKLERAFEKIGIRQDL